MEGAGRAFKRGPGDPTDTARSVYLRRTAQARRFSGSPSRSGQGSPSGAVGASSGASRVPSRSTTAHEGTSVLVAWGGSARPRRAAASIFGARVVARPPPRRARLDWTEAAAKLLRADTSASKPTPPELRVHLSHVGIAEEGPSHPSARPPRGGRVQAMREAPTPCTPPTACGLRPRRRLRPPAPRTSAVGARMGDVLSPLPAARWSRSGTPTGSAPPRDARGFSPPQKPPGRPDPRRAARDARWLRVHGEGPARDHPGVTLACGIAWDRLDRGLPRGRVEAPKRGGPLRDRRPRRYRRRGGPPLVLNSGPPESVPHAAHRLLAVALIDRIRECPGCFSGTPRPPALPRGRNNGGGSTPTTRAAVECVPRRCGGARRPRAGTPEDRPRGRVDGTGLRCASEAGGQAAMMADLAALRRHIRSSAASFRKGGAWVDRPQVAHLSTNKRTHVPAASIVGRTPAPSIRRFGPRPRAWTRTGRAP